MTLSDKTLIVITGPTASGKSALAVDVALTLGTEIISADSRQVFSGIPVATAMPSPEERNAVRHHLIDMLPLDAYYSASLFEQDALRIANSIWQSSKFAVVCGGSMMYVDALCHGLDNLPTVPDEIRRHVASLHANNGDGIMRDLLLKLDPDYYHEVDLKNIKRVVHAVEICMASGKPYSSLRTGERRVRPFRIVKICLDGPRELLFDRINSRVVTMMDHGLLEEALRVYPNRHLNSLNTVGLKELFMHFDNLLSLPEAIARIQKNTRVYAKKQLTWFKRDPSLIRIDISKPYILDKVLEEVQKS